MYDISAMAEKRNATASWSGYLHQGKVGIFVALQHINSLISEWNNPENIRTLLNDWKIVYECAEDFDIKRGDNAISRHQVKAYKDGNYPNDYKEVLSQTGFDINGVDRERRYLHTVVEVKGFYMSRDEFRNNYPDCIFVENPNNIQLFEYPHQNLFCPLINEQLGDKIKEYCISQIGDILTKLNHDEHGNKDWQMERLNDIISKLDDNIKHCHRNGCNNHPTISFNEIYELIVSNDRYVNSLIYSIREKFINCWTRFLVECDENGVEYCREFEIEIEKKIRTIYEKDNVSFIQFLKNINPDIKIDGNIDSFSDAVDLCNPIGLKDVFFECLIKVSDEDFIIDKIGYDKDGGYWLTAIMRNKNKVNSIVKAIINNSKLTKKIFEKSFLINGNIDGISFKNSIEDMDNRKSAEKKWGQDDVPEVTDIFYNPNMEFIRVDRATYKLNESESRNV